jgi:outer membrane lipoprotein-sorting protein
VKKILRLFAVVLGLIFICISCQQSQNPAEEYADKLLKAKKNAQEAAAATEQSQKDVNRAIDESEQQNK